MNIYAFEIIPKIIGTFVRCRVVYNLPIWSTFRQTPNFGVVNLLNVGLLLYNNAPAAHR